MNRFFKKWKFRAIMFLSVLGPGIISAIADNDAGGVATYSVVGSKFGYSILFVLLLATILLAITQEIGARIAIVTGAGLGDLIRERYGVRVSVGVFALLFLANMGSIVANFAGITAGLQLFNVPVLPFLIVFTLLIILFVALGNYQTNQKLFLLLSFLLIAYVISAVLVKPDWGLAVKSLLIPTNISFSPEFLFASIALLGTTVTPWGQFFISSFINDKKLSREHLRYEQAEVYFGSFLTDFFAFFIVVAVAGTLFANHIVANDAKEAALAIRPFAGSLSTILFGIGLVGASYMGAVIIPLTTAYAFSEFFGTEGSLDLPFAKSPLFYALFLFQIIIAFVIVLFPQISLFKIVLFTQSLNGLLLPLVIFFLLKFANDKKIMGTHTNNRFYNIFAIGACVLIIACSGVILLSPVLRF
jgi:Mn2+/Fe2+ NRAMP family transporter